MAKSCSRGPRDCGTRSIVAVASCRGRFGPSPTPARTTHTRSIVAAASCAVVPVPAPLQLAHHHALHRGCGILPQSFRSQPHSSSPTTHARSIVAVASCRSRSGPSPTPARAPPTRAPSWLRHPAADVPIPAPLQLAHYPQALHRGCGILPQSFRSQPHSSSRTTHKRSIVAAASCRSRSGPSPTPARPPPTRAPSSAQTPLASSPASADITPPESTCLLDPPACGNQAVPALAAAASSASQSCDFRRARLAPQRRT